MTADLMFKELGYQSYEWQGYGVTYYKPKRRIHICYDFIILNPGTVETDKGFVKPTKAEKEAIKQKLKEIRNAKNSNTSIMQK